MSDEIKKQEEIVLAAFSESERIAKEAEAKMCEWDNLRDAETAAYAAWWAEYRLLRKMKEEADE
jgi:hypothetical protein